MSYTQYDLHYTCSITGSNRSCSRRRPENHGRSESAGYFRVSVAGKPGECAGRAISDGSSATCRSSCGAENTGKFCTECGAAQVVGWTCSCGAVHKGKFCTECGDKFDENDIK